MSPSPSTLALFCRISQYCYIKGGKCGIAVSNKSYKLRKIQNLLTGSQFFLKCSAETVSLSHKYKSDPTRLIHFCSRSGGTPISLSRPASTLERPILTD